MKLKRFYAMLIASVVAYMPVSLVYASNNVDAKHHSNEGAGGFPQFDSSSYASQVFWLSVAFILTYLILSKLAMPKIAYVIDVRNSQKEGDLSKAEELNNEAEEAYKKYEEAIAEAHDKVRDILQDAKDDILEQHTAKYEKFNQDTQEKFAEAEASIKEAIDKAMSEITIHATDLASFASEKLSMGEISNDDTKKIVTSIWKKGDIA